MKRREVSTAVILSIVTCGIYALYWFTQITDDSNEVSGCPTASGGMALLFVFLTCDIYFFYWMYKLGQKLDMTIGDGGNRAILYLILAFVPCGALIVYALAQSELNRIIDGN